jgi:lysophospholipase L1-like esterase
MNSEGYGKIGGHKDSVDHHSSSKANAVKAVSRDEDVKRGQAHMSPTDISATSPRRFSPVRIVAYLAIVFFLLFLALELAWRTYLFTAGRGFLDNPNEFTSPFFTTYEEPAPIKWRSTAWYRNAEVPVLKPDNEIRIICFGGSTTVSRRAGVNYPQILDLKFLDLKSDNPVRILNAGGDSFSTAHTLVNLSLRNLELDPDIIVVYHNINDLSVKDFGDWAYSDYANKYKSDFYLGLRHRTGVIAELTKVSRLARYVVSSSQSLAFPTNQYGEAGRTSQNNDYSQALLHFTTNLRNIAAVAREHGILLVFASQAAKSDVRRNAGFAAFNQAIQQIADQEGAVFVDAANSMTDDDLFLEDSIHYTRQGVERLANIFYPYLQDLVREVESTRPQ